MDGIPPALRDELATYVLATSFERARAIGELTTRNPAMADLLIDVEADDDLRARSRWPSSIAPRRALTIPAAPGT